MTNKYQEFINSKKLAFQPLGIEVDPDQLHPILKPHQRDVTVWAVRKGRAAVFLDTGLGKTFIELEWARLLGVRTLIIAPLQPAWQTVKEAYKLGQAITYVSSQAQVNQYVKRQRVDGHPVDLDDIRDGHIFITNYENAHKFDPTKFGAVALDESSILKALDSKTRIALTEQWKDTPYRLCLSATPAPNDLKELVNHADFLGIMSRKEIFATFFINDTKADGQLNTRLKRHAVKPFYQWLSQWAVALKSPADLGYDATGYDLPPLNIHTHTVLTDYRPDDKLFFVSLAGVQDRAKVQRATLQARVDLTVLIAKSTGEQIIIWHHLNDEGYALMKHFDDAVLVEGASTPEQKTEAFEGFIDGRYRVLITKPEIAGFGMNFQQSHVQIWNGINDSYEEFYQAVRRQYRFGQTAPVEVHVVYADVQEAIWENVQRKANEAEALTYNLVDQMREFEEQELKGQQRGEDYKTDTVRGENWTLHIGDSCDPAGPFAHIADNSVGLTITSIPFFNRYAYSATERDLGNCSTAEQFMQQWAFQIKELYRTTMSGRNAGIHVQQVRYTKRDSGDTHPGLIDLRGMVVKAMTAEGFIYYGDYTIQKSAQMQAKRKHHIALLYKTKNTDSSKSCSALADYLLVFKKPGENPAKIDTCDVPDVTWNTWAQPVWYDEAAGEGFRAKVDKLTREQLIDLINAMRTTWDDINEIDVLDTQKAKADDDEMHLAPLQLSFIERCIRLWSKPGEIVLDPFNGVGSTGVVAIEQKRRYIGIELKPEYAQTAVKNLRNTEAKMGALDLFSWAAMQQSEEAVGD